MPGAVAVCRCGCRTPARATTHLVAAALAVDDLDRAIEAGLLDCPSCLDCTPACSASLEAARAARRNALAARERFRARQARLQRRKAAAAARRAAVAVPVAEPGQDTVVQPPPGLPAAAAAALARAKARAAARKP